MSVLSNHLNRLLDWLENIGFQPPSREVHIVEIGQISRVSADGTYHVRRDELHKPPDYETRFDELLHAGYSWLNMSCYGVHDGLLIVAIEIPGPGMLCPGIHTSVNLSGPAINHDWNTSAVLTIE